MGKRKGKVAAGGGGGVLSLQRAVGEVEKQGRRGRRREGRAIFHPGFPWWGVNWGKEQSDSPTRE